MFFSFLGQYQYSVTALLFCDHCDCSLGEYCFVFTLANKKIMMMMKKS